jgi:hypothetical protein
MKKSVRLNSKKPRLVNGLRNKEPQIKEVIAMAATQHGRGKDVTFSDFTRLPDHPNTPSTACCLMSGNRCRMG